MSPVDRRRGDTVVRAYARALERGVADDRAPRSGWSPYGWTELALLPGSAVANSFACGHPLRFAELRGGHRVLDIGCGAGVDLLLAGRRIGPAGSVVGLDLTPAMAALAQANAGAAGLPNVTVVQGRMEELPLAGASFDWVTANGALSLSDDRPRVLLELARVLKRAGGAVLADLAFDERPDWLDGHAALADSCLAGALPAHAWGKALEAAGLEEVTMVERRAWSFEEALSLAQAELVTGAANLGDDGAPAAARAVAEALAGRLLSVTFSARRAA